MEKKNNNLILIGMPGAGKSTVGVVLAKKCGYRFVDSDLVIQDQYGKLLHELIESEGIDGFLKLEENVNASLVSEKCVIATGGSVVYEDRAMRHLQELGRVIYLQLSCPAIAARLGDLTERGVTFREGQTLQDLYEERVPLYEKYADDIIACEDKSIREIVTEIWEKDFDRET